METQLVPKVENEPTAEVNSEADAVESKPASEEPTLSRNAKKRLLKLEKKASFRQEKRKKEREQRKLKGKINMCIKESQNGEMIQIKRKTLKSNLMENSTNKLRIVIDCSFESMMNDYDTNHLCKQLSYCYAKNRRMESPLQFYLTRFACFFLFRFYQITCQHIMLDVFFQQK